MPSCRFDSLLIEQVIVRGHHVVDVQSRKQSVQQGGGGFSTRLIGDLFLEALRICSLDEFRLVGRRQPVEILGSHAPKALGEALDEVVP